MARFNCDRLIDKGGLADVWHGVDAATGQEVAVKFLRDYWIADNRARFAREVKQLLGYQHARIMRIVFADTECERPFLVMPYMPKGKATTYARRLTYDQVRRVAADVAEALEHLHKFNALHRDIKPDNILMDSDGSAIVADFGLGNDARFTVHVTMNGHGTPGFMPPEYQRGGGASRASDMFGLGASIFQLITGMHPARATTLDPAKFCTNVPDDLRGLVLELTAQDPEVRPNAENVLIRLGRRQPPTTGTGMGGGLLLAGLAALLLIGLSKRK